MSKRKYPKLDLSDGKHYVYTHTANGMVYVGASGMQPVRRWNKSKYKGKFKDFIDEVGFDNMQHEVVCICDNREDARLLEDAMICMFTEKGVCLNMIRSGGVESDDEYVKARAKARYDANSDSMKAQSKSRYEAKKDEILAKNKAYRAAHKYEINEQKKTYYEAHRDEIIEKTRLRRQSKKSPKPNE